jgi:hypothetical protein
MGGSQVQMVGMPWKANAPFRIEARRKIFRRAMVNYEFSEKIRGRKDYGRSGS